MAVYLSLDLNDPKVAKWIEPIKKQGLEEIEEFGKRYKKDEYIKQLEEAFNQY